jgi:hypothetical protein
MLTAMTVMQQFKYQWVRFPDHKLPILFTGKRPSQHDFHTLRLDCWELVVVAGLKQARNRPALDQLMTRYQLGLHIPICYFLLFLLSHPPHPSTSLLSLSFSASKILAHGGEPPYIR